MHQIDGENSHASASIHGDKPGSAGRRRELQRRVPKTGRLEPHRAKARGRARPAPTETTSALTRALRRRPGRRGGGGRRPAAGNAPPRPVSARGRGAEEAARQAGGGPPRPDGKRPPPVHDGRGPLNDEKRPLLAGGVLLSHGLHRSTIGARGLNFRVRDGTGCASPAMAAGQQGAFSLPLGAAAVPSGPHSAPSDSSAAGPPGRPTAAAPVMCRDGGEELGRLVALG